MFEIVGIGASIYDTILALPSYPEEDSKVRADKLLKQCGGPAATGLAAAARLGAKAAYLGLLADDEGGRGMLEEFRQYGVGTQFVKMEKEAVSPSAVVLTALSKTSRTIIWTPGTLRSPEPEDIPEKALLGARLLHLDGHHWKAALHAAKTVKRQGGEVLLDAGDVYEGTEELVEISDILIASEGFAAKYTGIQDPEESVNRLRTMSGARILIVTQGARGGIYWKNGEFRRYPACSPPGGVVDTTGAGDVFHGAFAFAHTRGWKLETSISFASAVAALKCTKPGGRSGIPDYEETVRYLTENPPFIN